jgi:methyl-accepting chemotaxis protein
MVRALQSAMALSAHVAAQDSAIRSAAEAARAEAKAIPPRLAHVLSNVIEAMAKMAVTTARHAVGLGAIARHCDENEETIGAVATAATGLVSGVAEVAAAGKETSALASSMHEMTRGGAALGAEMLRSSQAARDEMIETRARLATLIDKVQRVGRVSQVISEVSAHSRLLSLNASIEAARAGESGKGFAVVASEVRALSVATARHAEEIDRDVSAILAELAPAQESMARSGDLIEKDVELAAEVSAMLRQLSASAEQASANMANIETVTLAQQSALTELAASAEGSRSATAAIARETEEIRGEGEIVARAIEGTFGELGHFDTGTMFHKRLSLARELAGRSRALFDAHVARGDFSERDALALDYTPIGPGSVASVGRLFDASRAAVTGFDPPKYHTAYDQMVDVELRALFDEIKGRDPGLVFAILFDLNGYTAAHNSVFCKDWTGDPAKDGPGNRAKRIFADRSLLRGARVGLRSEKLPLRATQDQLAASGDLLETESGALEFLLQSYARDTGEIMAVMSVPVFVGRRRFGGAAVAWMQK